MAITCHKTVRGFLYCARTYFKVRGEHLVNAFRQKENPSKRRMPLATGAVKGNFVH